MSKSRKRSTRTDLALIEDALIDSILSLTEDDIRLELNEAGTDAETCVAEVDALITAAKAKSVRQRLTAAPTELAAWREREPKTNTEAIDSARAKMERLQSGDPKLREEFMLAARKGEGLSEKDMEGLLEDLAALEELEGDQGDE